MIRSLDRRSFLRLGAGAGLMAATAPLLSSCSLGSSTGSEAAGSATGADGLLRIGYLPITDSTPLILAHARGLYADEGLDAPKPTLFRSWASIAEAFTARRIDVAHLLMPLAVQLLLDQDVPLRVVAWNHTDGSALTVGPDITEVGDLAGRTIAIPFWHSIHNIVLQMLLRDAGIRPIIKGTPSEAEGTVRLTVMGPPDMPPALANGDIAGYIVADPFNSFAELEGIGRVLRHTGDVWQEHACCVVVMHEDRIREDPAWAQATINAITSAQAHARADRAGTARLLSRDGEGYLPQPEGVITRALAHLDDPAHAPTGRIHHPDWSGERIDFQPFPYASYTEQLVAGMQETVVDGDRSFLDDLDPAAVHDRLVEDRFVRSVLEDSDRRRDLGVDGFDRDELVDV